MERSSETENKEGACVDEKDVGRVTSLWPAADEPNAVFAGE